MRSLDRSHSVSSSTRPVLRRGVVVAALTLGALAWSVGACTYDFNDDQGQGAGGQAATTSTQASGSLATSSTSSLPATTTTSATGMGGAKSTSSANGSSSTGSGGPTVLCGDPNGSCAMKAGGCCWDSTQGTGQCSTTGTCPGIATQASCQLPSDCANKICCGKRNNAQSPYDILDCEPACDSPSVTLCDPANPACPTVAPNCVMSVLLPPGYYVCSI